MGFDNVLDDVYTQAAAGNSFIGGIRPVEFVKYFL